MKNNQTPQPVESQVLRVESKPDAASFSSPPQLATFNSQLAFTLIELLVVISIIGILAAFTIPALKSFKRTSIINQTKAEMAQLETAIDSFKAAYGFYPPTGTNDARVNPLYFELLGTSKVTIGGNPCFQTLDTSANIKVADVPKAFPGLDGFVNCTKPGAGEDAPAARNFLSGLKEKRIGVITNPAVPPFPVTVLVAAVGGPDENYQPFNAVGVNPWRYACPGTNNPNSYDLWMQLSINGKMNLICNWSKQVQFNSSLP